MSQKIAQEYLKSALDYDPETGVFVWRVRPQQPPEWNSRYALCIAGGVNCEGYRRIVIDYVGYLAHHLAWLYVTGEWAPEEIDHINGNPSDNRFANLRAASRKQNSFNRKRASHNKCGFKGVKWHAPRSKWVAWITADSKKHYLGYFATPEAAHAAYCKAAIALHGEFARCQ